MEFYIQPQHIAIEAVWSKSFVEVGALRSCDNIVFCEGCHGVYHLLIVIRSIITLHHHMLRSLVDVSEVVADGFLHLGLFFEDLHVTIVTGSFDLGHDRVASFDPHDLVRKGVELLHPIILQ